MKTAISLPNALFKKAEWLAARLGKSRSRLYQEAVAEYVARHAADLVTRAMDTVVSAVSGRPDPFAKRAAVHTLRRVEWEE